MSLRDEIRQTKPFGAPSVECYLSLLRTSDLLLREFEAFFRPLGLTEPRYNALRILRGAGPAGLPCREVAARMVTRAPDLTRLLDGLEADGLVARSRADGDRRVVRARATAKALRLLARIEGDLLAIHRRQFDHMAASEVRALVALLERVREGSHGGAA